MKKYWLRLVEIELSVHFSPHFANTFSVSRNFTKMLYRKVVLTTKIENNLFEYFQKRIINEFRAETINEIKTNDFMYFDFNIKEDYLTLHSEIFTGISIFPTKLENSTKNENDSTEYYALKLICSENPYANFVTLQDGAKMGITYLLENILDARTDKGKYHFKELSTKENFSYTHCDICNGDIRTDEKNWISERIVLCVYCYKEYVIKDDYFDKLRNMKREEILEF
ncbi:MAG: hypothetical protein BGO40_07200 [Chryseobacterium sp. 39-10]|nr:MAG: hypothetical protein BGO40_07200 [Chryseobacterium sp. 39-10]